MDDVKVGKIKNHGTLRLMIKFIAIKYLLYGILTRCFYKTFLDSHVSMNIRKFSIAAALCVATVSSSALAASKNETDSDPQARAERRALQDYFNRYIAPSLREERPSFERVPVFSWSDEKSWVACRTKAKDALLLEAAYNHLNSVTLYSPQVSAYWYIRESAPVWRAARRQELYVLSGKRTRYEWDRIGAFCKLQGKEKADFIANRREQLKAEGTKQAGPPLSPELSEPDALTKQKICNQPIMPQVVFEWGWPSWCFTVSVPSP